MSGALALNALPNNIDEARLPIVYERATQALAECSRIDECQDWANKAEAMASYARQAKDETLHKLADRIMARAIRRCGELLKQIEPGQGARDGKRPDATVMPLNRTEAATQAGLSERQKVTALRVASIPTQEFERVVESATPPTKTQLSELGKASKPQPLHELNGIDPRHYARAGAGRTVYLPRNPTVIIFPLSGGNPREPATRLRSPMENSRLSP